MSWIETEQYRAIIGGCYFLNVPRIIEHNGRPFITIKKNAANGHVGVDADILNATSDVVARIRNGQITLLDNVKFRLLNDDRRSSIVEIKTGKILYDMQLFPEDPDLDFRLSIITHLTNRLPIFLHPNRIRIGSPNILKPHITSLKLATRRGMEGPAIKIKVSITDKLQECLHVPRVPMVGQGGVVAKLLTTKAGQVDSEMSGLMMSGEENRTANISFDGPCYFLDAAFENFKTAIAIDSPLPAKPMRGQ